MLKNKIALVTGASKGIGAAITIELAKSGATVLINYNSSELKAKEVLNEARKYSQNSEIIKCNVSKKEEVVKMVEEIKSKHKKIDILVNNAGITKDRTLKKMSDEEWNEVISTNLNSIFYVTKNTLEIMPEGSSIVNLSSIVGINGNFGQCNYSASKSAIIGFTKSLAKELGKHKIRVNAIAPGFIDTEMTSSIPFITKKIIISQIPLQRMGTTEEVAKLAVFLASDASGYITGQVIRIDGGLNF